MGKKGQPHQIYKTKDGTKVVGVTTVLGVLNKPALVGWANRLGLEGIEVGKYVDNLADIGTLAHALIEAHLRKEQFDTSDYSKNQIDKAENAVLKFFEWEKQHKLEPIAMEAQLVSETHKYGGTCDIYCKLDGKLTLIDIKTAKAVYGEHHTQCVAYEQLLNETGNKVEDVLILRVGREETEGFEVIPVTKRALHLKKFLAALDIYNLNRALAKKED